MERRKVDTPGLLGSPLTTAASAPGGSVVGNDQFSDAGSVEDCAVAPGAVRSHTDAAIKTHRRRATRVLSSIFASPSHEPQSMSRGAKPPAARPRRVDPTGQIIERRRSQQLDDA